jgi:hypothetical protein
MRASRVACDMPKLGKYAEILNTVFFLYENEEDARRGENSGGTGFLVAVYSDQFGAPNHYIHGVTNYHVAVSNSKGSSASVIRINRKIGPPEIFDLDPSQWVFRPRWHDIAVSPPLNINSTVHDAVPLLGESWWLSSSQETADEIGPADDIFMIGRFIDYDGAETNSPALRFGHISIKDAKIEQPTGFLGRSIVVDLHSRSGFSGSPVIVYRTLGSHFIEVQPGQILTGGGHYIKLLGILWGAFPERWELENDKAKIAAKQNASLITEGSYVKGLSGMSCVIPSAYIEEIVMNDLTLKSMRARCDEETGRQLVARLSDLRSPSSD